MNVADARLCLLLHGLTAIDDPTLARLLLQSGSPAELAAGGPALWRELGLPARPTQALARTLAGGASVDVDRQLSALVALGADILPITDPRYPPLLRTIHAPPPLLYVRGDAALLSQAQLAMVGSRKASPAGLRAAGAFAAQAVGAGLHVTSGLARGIDGAAHRGALVEGGRSIAVVATGIDRVYPACHRELVGELEKAGCLVSEFPPGVPPLPYNFPRRNRIISGLSLGVLLVEAALPSGSLITARTAVEQGREVFALPWSIYHSGGAGCLHLIRDGARMVETIRDVLEELGPLYALQQDLLPPGDAVQSALQDLTESQQQVLSLVGFEFITVDELSRLSALPVARLLAELSYLELLGLLARGDAGYIRS